MVFVNCKAFINAVRRYLYLPFPPKGGFEAFQQQWMSLPRAWYPISCNGRITKTCYFVRNLRADLGGNDTSWNKRSFFMLSEAYPISLIHLRKILKHSISNGCLSLQHSIPFPVLRWHQKSDILYINWVLTSGEITKNGPYGACRCCQKLLSSFSYF